jgi:ABC-type Na+ efflux pump permease subunit
MSVTSSRLPDSSSRISHGSGRSGSPQVVGGILTIARYVLAEALFSRLLIAALAIAGIGLGIAWFAGEMAITESASIQGSALAAFSRIAAMLLVVSFVVSGLIREQADKGLELLLSLAIPRASYVVGKLLGYTALAWLSAAAFSLPLLVFAPPANVAAWAIALAFELTIVAAAALAAALVIGQSALCLLVVTAFYALSRIMPALLAITANPVAPAGSSSFTAMTVSLHAIAILLPALDRFASAAWLWHGPTVWSLLAPAAMQFAIYLPLLMALAMFDFYRKNL